jgi:outer membrane protein TolC
MIKRIFLILLLFQPLLAVKAIDPLDRYINEGLKNNLALKQQEFSLERSLEALNEAKGMFFPSVSLQARYSRAGGGRLIEVPIGDLVNPVYKSLNMLFGFHGIPGLFPTDLPNEVFPFLREREQETKFRVIQPLFQPAIYHNYKLKSSLTGVQQAQVSVFKRQLIADVETAYFNYAKALSVVELLDKTRELLEENLRISENLVENGKATEDVIFRARAEIADLDQQRAEADKNKSLAATYLNFLINRNLDEPITISRDRLSTLPESVDLEKAIQRALAHRDEFEQMQNAIKAASHQIGLATSNFLPSVFAVVDYGIQGEEYRFGRDDDYWMASLIFEWNIFNGNQNRAKKAQAALEKKKLEVQMQELDKQIQMQVTDAFHALKAARLAVTAAEEKEKTAKRSFEIVSKKYEYGMAAQIEFLDARTTFTNAAISHIIARADFFIKKAQFEHASALVNLEKYQ